MGILSQEDSELDHSFNNSQFSHFVDSLNPSKIREKNGDYYKGEIKDKQKHGYGILYYANDPKYVKYEGFWKQNKKHSSGIMHYKDGSIYNGQWKNDKRNGEGELYYSNGEKFKGSFKEDKREGKGYYYSKNNSSIFLGNYTNDVKNGKGITFYKKNNKRSIEFWKNGVIISCIIEKNINELNNSSILNKNEFKLFSINNNDNKNKINSLNIIKNSLASTNNFFDVMNFVLKTYTLLYDKGDINEWKENIIIKLFEKIGIEKNKYNDIILNNQITGEKFLKLNLNDLKEYKINDIDAKIITKAISFLREYYKRYYDFHKEYDKKEEDAKTPMQMKTPIKKIPSNLMRKSTSTKIFQFSKERVESNDSLSKMNKISEEDLINNDSLEFGEVSPNKEKDIYSKDIQSDNEKKKKSKDKDNKKFKRRENKSITIRLEKKPKKKDNIENLGFALIKLSITNLFIHSLQQNGFDFYIPFDEIQKEEEIEQDDICFQIFKGKWQGKQIIIKCVSVDKLKKDFENSKNYNKLTIGNIMQNFIKEINIYNNLRHPNIILFIGISIHKNDFYMIFEYPENHSLYEILHKKNPLKRLLKIQSNEINKKESKIKEISEKKEEQNDKDNLNLSINEININDDIETEQTTSKTYIEPYDKFHSLDEITQGKILFQISYEISVALRYIHSRNILHCNLKTNCLFLDEEYHVKLGNFFYSKILNYFSDENKEEDYFIENQEEWTPPEIIKNGKLEESSDVYRLGLVLYEIFTGEIPHKGIGSNQIIGINYIVSEKDKKSRSLVNLIQRCVSEDPKNRPNLEYISNFLYNYSKFYDKREFYFEEVGNFMMS